MKKLLLLLVFPGLIVSCSNKPHKLSEQELRSIIIDSIEKQSQSGEFVYQDKDSVIHMNLNCGYPIDDIKNEVKENHGVKRIEKKFLTVKQLEKCCSNCIDDKQYKYLKSIADSIHNGLLKTNKQTIKKITW